MPRNITASSRDRLSGSPGKVRRVRVLAPRSSEFGLESDVLFSDPFAARFMSNGTLTSTDDINSISGNNARTADDRSSSSIDMETESGDMAASAGDMATKSGAEAARSHGKVITWWNLLTWLHAFWSKSCNAVSEWYWRRSGLSDPALRRYYREASFDEFFTIEYEVCTSAHPSRRPRGPWREPTSIADFVEYLVFDVADRQDNRLQFAFLLAFLRRVLRPINRAVRTAVPWSVALAQGIGSGALKQRPPPLAFN